LALDLLGEAAKSVRWTTRIASPPLLITARSADRIHQFTDNTPLTF